MKMNQRSGDDEEVTEKRLLELVAVAKKAADAVAMKRLPSTHPEFSRCFDALTTLNTTLLSSPSSSNLNIQISKCLQLLTLHPKVRIRTEATNVLQALKTPPSTATIYANAKPNVVVPKAFNVVAKSSEGGPRRDEINQQIQEALSRVLTDEANDESTRAKAESCDPVLIANSIASLLKKNMGHGVKNKAKCRSVVFNLKDPKNPDLRRRVLFGEIKPHELVEMSSEEMASRKRKMENEEMRVKAMMRCQTGVTEQETTDQFRCGRCGQRKCSYCQMQTRSADEPMTTFVRCVVCCNRWKFC